MKLLSLYSPSDLARHYFSSNLYGEQQIDAAYLALENCPSANTEAQWKAILGAVHSLPWVTNPKDVQQSHLTEFGIVGLCGHFWNSELDNNLAENILNAAYNIVESKGENEPTWFLVKEMAENQYREWANEKLKWQALQADACGHDHSDNPSGTAVTDPWSLPSCFNRH